MIPAHNTLPVLDTDQLQRELSSIIEVKQVKEGGFQSETHFRTLNLIYVITYFINVE